jgi:hypothetical protein
MRISKAALSRRNSILETFSVSDARENHQIEKDRTARVPA